MIFRSKLVLQPKKVLFRCDCDQFQNCQPTLCTLQLCLPDRVAENSWDMDWWNLGPVTAVQKLSRLLTVQWPAVLAGDSTPHQVNTFNSPFSILNPSWPGGRADMPPPPRVFSAVTFFLGTFVLQDQPWQLLFCCNANNGKLWKKMVSHLIFWNCIMVGQICPPPGLEVILAAQSN